MGRLSTWVFGVALLAGVILFVTHLGDAETFLHLLRSVEPRWFAVAVFLQVATYFCAGEVLKQALAFGAQDLPRSRSAALALAKLFLDQTLPSGGLSGTYLIARHLQRMNFPNSLISAALIIDMTGFYIAYVLCLLSAMAVFSVIQALPLPWLLFVTLFGAAVLTLTFWLWRMAGHPHAKPPAFMRLKRLQELFHFIQQSDVRVARNLSMRVRAVTLHVLVFLIDSSTLWTLTAALGHSAPWPSVFVSFLLSSLVRTLGVIPGGIGTFEAASVFTLRLLNVPVSIGLSATLLFRGLSFWLPMLPGMWLSRRLTKPILKGQEK